MIGRQEIKTNRSFTLEELAQYMNEHWDKEHYNNFIVGRPTAASIEKYIMLPATERFMVIVYPRKKGLLNKNNKVILAVCNTEEGAKQELIRSLHSNNAIFGAIKIGMTLSMEDERKGPAEDALLKYTSKMKELLSVAGYTLG